MTRAATNSNSEHVPEEEEEEEEEYMNMTFEDPKPAKETSLQRTQRLKREARERGIIKSKEQKAEEDAAAREKALATSLLDDPKAKKSKGFAMMSKMGFTGGGLGRKGEDGKSQGRTEPISVSVREDRGGIGLESEKKRQLQEAAEEMGIPNKAPKLDPDEYRERLRREREDARVEKQLYAAQRMAERLDDGAEGSQGPAGTAAAEAPESKVPRTTPIASRPLKSIPVLYRGLVRHREEQEQDRRMRHDLEQSLSRLPTYDDESEDNDDKKALGKGQTAFSISEDLDEEDAELDHFNALALGDRLKEVLEFLRQRHHYCFWCKMAYGNDKMEGCPGLSEENHD